MPLSDFVPDTKDVVYRGKTLVTVRGLHLGDVGVLMRRHIDDLRTLYRMFDPSGKLLPSEVDIDGLLFSLITYAPETAAKMIALASDEPENTEQAKRLPAPLQLQILIEIVKLTFEDTGGPLEFGAMLRQTFLSQLAALTSNSRTIQ